MKRVVYKSIIDTLPSIKSEFYSLVVCVLNFRVNCVSASYHVLSLKLGRFSPLGLKNFCRLYDKILPSLQDISENNRDVSVREILQHIRCYFKHINECIIEFNKMLKQQTISSNLDSFKRLSTSYEDSCFVVNSLLSNVISMDKDRKLETCCKVFDDDLYHHDRNSEEEHFTAPVSIESQRFLNRVIKKHFSKDGNERARKPSRRKPWRR
ncbi:hypothetical protein ACFLY6_03085 [Candidatus Dependentiae bacterium]